MNTKMAVAAVLIVAAIVGIFVFLKGYYPSDNRIPQPAATTSPSLSAEEYAGSISTTAFGQQIYTNTKYGFQFTFPQGWQVGNNILGMPHGGTLQLFNYAEKDPATSPKGFIEGQNKIEAAIINSSDSSAKLFSETPDYPIKSREPVSLNFAGETVPGVNVELAGGEKRRTFVVPLLHTTKKSLMISIYGDPSNFFVLDDLVKSITWK